MKILYSEGGNNLCADRTDIFVYKLFRFVDLDILYIKI